MNESNPLYVVTFPTGPKNINKSGRPTNGNRIKFGPQPKSYISKLIKQIAVEKCNKSKTNEDNTRETSAQPPKDSSQHNKNIFEKDCKRKNYECDYPDCKYSCKLSCNMSKHKRIHSPEKRYLCDKCSFQTNFVNSLKVHFRIHNNEKPHSCKHCSYRCNSSSNLKKHCKHKHSKTLSVELADLT